MKALLAKLALHRAIGLHLGEHEVAVSEVAFTPLGPIETAAGSEACTPENMASVIERLMTPLLKGKRRVPVAVGLPNSRIFFGTRLTRSGGEVTAESVLQKAFSSPNIRVEDLTIDLLRSTINKMPVASVAACRKKYMGNVIGMLNDAGIRPTCAEPESCALVRLAAFQHRFPRRSKLVLCVFLNATHGLAVAVASGLPLAWRSFPLPEGSESLTILSAARTLQTQNKHYGLEASPDYAMIFGREDLHEHLRKEQFPSDLGTRVMWHSGPELSAQATAFGLALSSHAASEQGFDLSRNLKSRPSIAEIFPWADLAFATVLVACMGGVLSYHHMRLNDTYARVKIESSQHPCLTGNAVGHLEKDEKDIRLKIQAVDSFLQSRVLWTMHIRNMARHLPPSVQLRSFVGTSELQQPGKNATAQKTLILKANAPITEKRNIPREIEAFVSELRNDSLMKRDFGSIELTDIKTSSNAAQGGKTEATFTIYCLPKAKGQ